MTLKVSISGLDSLQKKLAEASPNAKLNATIALEKASIGLQGAVKKLIAKQSAGKRVIRKGIAHTISKPGDAPNTDEGDLIDSYQYNVDTNELEATVGSDLSYSVDLEFGTKKMAARPHLSVAYLMKEKSIKKRFKVELKGSLGE